MTNIYENDIIVGISTAFMPSAISIIRLSGKGSIELVNKIFKGKDLTNVDSHTIHYGKIIDNNNEQLDEVLVSIFKAPKTYTVEDVVEINCHGGLFVTNQVYEELVFLGARPAEPGEFTKRAFLNGRIDLTKAEAVMDLINAENSSATKIANKALSGRITNTIEEFTNELLHIISIISVNIDYPEYDDVEELTTQTLKPLIESLVKRLKKLLENSKSVKYIKSGINTAIIGKPNVGKSSILNELTGTDAAIVTSIPGTTRDTIETKINIGSLTLNLIDTAGIRETEDIVEKIGVEKSLAKLNDCDLVLLIFDGSLPLSTEDRRLIDLIDANKTIKIINKCDLKQKIEKGQLEGAISVSALKHLNIDLLEEKIKEKLHFVSVDLKDMSYVSNIRQSAQVAKAVNELEEALKAIEKNDYIDFIDIYIRDAYYYLGEITGVSNAETLINDLFSKFCLGK